MFVWFQVCWRDGVSEYVCPSIQWPSVVWCSHKVWRFIVRGFVGWNPLIGPSPLSLPTAYNGYWDGKTWYVKIILAIIPGLIIFGYTVCWTWSNNFYLEMWSLKLCRKIINWWKKWTKCALILCIYEDMRNRTCLGKLSWQIRLGIFASVALMTLSC